MSKQQDCKIDWYCTPNFHFFSKIIFGIILAVCFYNGVINKDNDFKNHYLLGQTFIQKSPYVDGHFCTHYPLGRLLLDVPFALLPYRLSRGIWWIIGVVVLSLSLRTWERMDKLKSPLTSELSCAALVFSLGLSLRWLMRDLDDCGQQLLLLALLTYAGWATWHKRNLLTGLLLGTAVAYKLTPMLFLPLLLYKRRWKASLWMIGFILLWNLLLPALYLGFPTAWQANKLFVSKSQEIIQASAENPSVNGVEPAKHQNRNLGLAIARYLQTYPPGAPLFIAKTEDANDTQPHPLFVQFLDLPPLQAGLVIKLILLAIALALAVRYRYTWKSGSPADFPKEWSIAMALCALMSPLCWGQHMVLFMPLVLLIIRRELGQHRLLWRRLLLWTATFLILLPQREVLGQTLWLITQSYKVETWGAVLLLILAYTHSKEIDLNVLDTSADSNSDNPQTPHD